MKNKILLASLAAIIICYSNGANAQWINYNTVGTFVDAITDYNVPIRNVGINIQPFNNVNYRLDVNGDGHFVNDLTLDANVSVGNNATISSKTSTSTFQMTSGASANYILQSDASGNATWVAPSTLTTATPDLHAVTSVDNKTTNSASFGASVAPVNTLDLYGTDATPANTSNATNGSLRIRNASAPVALDAGINTSGNNYTWLQSRSASNYATNYDLAINPNGGNVGIGTTSAGTPLHVYNGTGGDILRIQGGSNPNLANIIFSDHNSGLTDVARIGTHANTLTINVEDVDMYFETIKSGTLSEKMRIKDNGNVGIGTASPGHTLDVRGDGYIGFTDGGTNNVASVLTLAHSSTSTPSGGGFGSSIDFWNKRNSGVGDVQIASIQSYFATPGNANSGIIAFQTASSGSAPTTKMIIDDNGNVGIGTTSPSYKLDVNGTTQCSGNVWASDFRYKKNIKDLDNVKSDLFKIIPKSYEFRTSEFKEKGFDEREHLGFIAQELEKVFPNLTYKDSKGFYAVNYIEFIPLLLQALKEEDQTVQAQQKVNTEQQQQIAELKNELAELKASLDICCAANHSTGLNDPKNNGAHSTLDQNVPNPFGGSTVIGFKIVGAYSRAFIGVYDMNGRQIRTMPITAGMQNVTVEQGVLVPGMYTYSLVVDNNLIDTKKMVVTE